MVTTEKFALELPWGTVTEEGIEATAEDPASTARVTGVSALTGAKNVTVPVVLLFPPRIEVGENTREEGVLADTVNITYRTVPLAEAEILTWVGTDKALV